MSQGLSGDKFREFIGPSYLNAEKHFHALHNKVYVDTGSVPDKVRYEEVCGAVCTKEPSQEFVCFYAGFRKVIGNFVSQELRKLKLRNCPTHIAVVTPLVMLEVHDLV